LAREGGCRSRRCVAPAPPAASESVARHRFQAPQRRGGDGPGRRLLGGHLWSQGLRPRAIHAAYQFNSVASSQCS
jgi:hypothetical protein